MIDKGILLEIENLTVSYQRGDVWSQAIQNISLEIEAGQTIGVVGESGSGKTTLAMAILNRLGENARLDTGQVLFDGQVLSTLPDQALRKIWGKQIGLVPQDPFSSLNPSLRIGDQLKESLIYHDGIDQRAAEQRAIDLLQTVRLPDSERIMQSYPHQISGGMQQRIFIAMALSTQPKLLILDEPTTNLDVTTQAAMLDLFKDLLQGSQRTILYISHNLGVIARFCSRVVVLYAGEIVEDSPIEELFSHPLHPYTIGLLNSIPRLTQHKTQTALKVIPGRIPGLGERPQGCIFVTRCPLAIDLCKNRPTLISVGEKHLVRCHRQEEIAGGILPVLFRETGLDHHNSVMVKANPQEGEPVAIDHLLVLRQISVQFSLGRSISDFFSRSKAKKFTAVQQASLSIPRTLTLGIVGESGSGKTSLARAIAGLVEASDGEMEFMQMPLPRRISQRGIDVLGKIQMVFQNPEETLNPYMPIGEALSRPLKTLLRLSPLEVDKKVDVLLELVGLPLSYRNRKPQGLSGGEKQRVAIARAFASHPDLLIADEPVSALDVSIQASIINLLNHLQAEHGITLLIISHDIAVIGYLSDIIAIIYLGQVVDIRTAQELFSPPYHPYTEALLSAIPVADPGFHQTTIPLRTEASSLIDRPLGCPFHTRCPRFIPELCDRQEPEWQEDEHGVRVKCHISLSELRSSQKSIIDQMT